MNNTYPTLTHSELNILIRQLAQVFDIVRTVDASMTRVLTFDADGRHVQTDRHCYEVWNRAERCTNCISSMAFRDKTRLTKFEFVGEEIYHVVTQYVEVDHVPCLLEIVEKDSDLALSGTFGREAFVEKISQYTERVYQDSLTLVNNRRYYDEQISFLTMNAMAMIDIDHFKEINDVYGHLCGDRILRQVAQTIRHSIREDDVLVRYGGDEFVAAFSEMEGDRLASRLETIRNNVAKIVVEDHPEIKLSISVGSVFGKATASELLAKADESLYEAKKYRNHVVVLEI